ncbi:MAG TPA: iron-containing redox enzyme family protein [Gemmatimonadales bacterium]|nr:iron-containing redox enzyme family protein [Gemmatimonadales bacterium]
MLTTEVNRAKLAPSFNGADPALAAGPTRLSYRNAFYHLVNVEEHPEVLPLAYDLVETRLQAITDNPGAPPAARADIPARLGELLDRLTAQRTRFSRPWHSDSEDLTRRRALHYFVQYMPTAFVDGCWLQCGLRVSTAHTGVGASLTGLYQHQVRAFVADPGRHFVADYRSVYGRLGAPVEEVSSHSFAERADFHESSLALPILLLAVAQFTRTFPGEILGLNLAWQYLDLSAFGPDLIRDTCRAYGLPAVGEDLNDPAHLETGRTMARDAAVRFLEEVEEQDLAEAWTRLGRGLALGVEAWTRWFEATRAAAPSGPPDPRQEVIDLFWRKAPHASGYHGNKRLGARKIDDFLDPKTFNGPAVLDALAASPWVKPGKADKSPILNRLMGFGGPMMAVFSPVEQQIIRTWIDSLPPREAQAETGGAAPRPEPGPAPSGPTIREEQYVSGRGWEPEAFRRRAQRMFGKCTVRELYHYLVNVEFYPEILPIAERFAHERLERSMAMLWKGERPIPSRHYDPAALEGWVYTKHREQVDSYRPPDVRPEAPKDAFIEATVQLAPLILIDGGWLQGMASPALIHTTVGRMLFHVLVEELGEGKSKEHHANIYRNLLKAMSVEPPPVDTWEFARWERLQDSSFEVPALWLTISCFPRHFLPEILGLNLAVELAGVGGPYMEARDTLRRFRYPTLFVDVHNAADNVSVGHAAWAMNAIKRYLDEVAERDGPHNVDRLWHRIWTGVRATLPQIGRARLLGHRIRRRFFGEDPTLVPLIFPS